MEGPRPQYEPRGAEGRRPRLCSASRASGCQALQVSGREDRVPREASPFPNAREQLTNHKLTFVLANERSAV